MAALVVVNNSYTGFGVYYRVLDYVLCPAPEKAWAEFVGSINLYLGAGIRGIAEQMMKVAEYYAAVDGQMLRHFCLSFDTFDTESWISPEIACQIGMQVCQSLFSEYQAVFAVHGGDQSDLCIHIHFVVNAVSFVDGRKFPDKKNTYKEMAGYISGIPVYVENEERSVGCQVVYRSNPKYRADAAG